MSPQCSRALALASLLVVLPVATAAADEVLGLYAGGALGSSQVAIDSLDFSANDLGWKALVGLRAVDLLGAEAEYVNLGHPHATVAAGRVSSSASGPAVFALAYLPLPLPMLDVFGKAGLANIQQSATVTLGSGGSACAAGIACNGLSQTESEFAWGVGAQVKYGSLAVRGEFEQFRASGGNLNFASVGLYWNFF
jgi:hypothetical protein